MNRTVLGIVAIIVGLCSAGGCSIDDRKLSTRVTSGDSGSPSGGENGAPGGAPRLEVSPSSADLGWVTVGFPARARIQVSNTGGSALREPVIALASGSDPAIAIIQNQCSGSLLAGASCELRVQALPSAAGALRGELTIQSDGADSVNVALTAEGLTGGGLSVLPAAGSSEDFGGARLGTALDGTFTVSNFGSTETGPIAFQSNRTEFSIAAAADDASACVSGVTSLAVGASCDLRLSYAPAQRGPVEALLTARAAAGAASVRLLGVGLAPAALQASADRIDFDGVVVGQGAQRVVAFENAGDEPLTLSGAGLEPADADGYAVLNSDCGSDRVLAAGESCSVIVEYRPSRSGLEAMAQLWASAGDQRQLVPLRGIGLDSGVLTIAPQTPGEEDFGAVPLSGSVVRSFSVTNPGAQPSGVLGVSVGDGFEIQLPPEPGECGHPATSIINGQACSVRVRFVPSARQDYRRALTVSSALAGASSLTLAGRGVAPAAFEVNPEIDFGRVFTSASTRRTLSVRNNGDEPLAPPSIEVVGSPNVMAPAFSYVSACLAPLGNGEACDIVVSFAPIQPVAHWAELKLVSAPAASASVLLVAEALAPGSLQLAPAPGGAADFGDVQIGTSGVQTFTISNPANVASGRIAVRVDSNRFQVMDTECSTLANGLEAGGATCAFAVQFTPDSSLDVIGNISVVSPGAGQAGLEIRGRGRAAATLVATGNRDLGRAIVGQDALTQPENQFTWTVNNQGDLATGALSVANDNQAEFEVTNDTCEGAIIPGAGACEMTIRFRPADVGPRGANIAVLDAASGRSATIVLTGIGDRLAQLGQSCVNATCAAGMCTGGVCCDRACDGACQVCSEAGVCVDQSAQEPCGNGDGRCFGVDRCLLPNGEACGQATDCGTGNCEPRLNGAGAADRICCDRACSALGLQCNGQGLCQQPTLEAGATCGSPSDPPCENGLECKTCLGGGSRCTPAGECCGGCQPGYTCLAGASCGCPAGQLDCGGGLCVQNRAGACCPLTPDCPAAQPNCDPADNLCKQCVDATDCPGANRACNAGACGCSFGSRDCGGGVCLPNNQCCETCSGGRTCQGGSCVCPQGQTFVNGQCVLPQGAACQVNGTPCSTGQCVDGVCCESLCQGVCTQCQAGTGRCVAPADDDACPAISCNAADSCRIAEPIINRCLGPGECKTAADCTNQLAPARTACGPAEPTGLGDIVPVCSATGVCTAPAINCRGVVGTITPTNCCRLDFPESDEALGFAPDCDPGGQGYITAACDSVNDCPLGNSCCLFDNGNFDYIACTSSCDELETADPFGAGVYLVCSSPGGGTSQCPGGRPCTRLHPDLDGWAFCAVP